MNNFMNVNANSILVKTCIFLIPVVLTGLFFCIAKFDYNLYLKVVDEDNIVEYMTAILYFLSSILALLISIRFIKNKYTFFGVSYAILACCLFFLFGEEISWGQRILNIETPAFLRRINSHHEVNIHNLYIFQSMLYKTQLVVGAYGAFSWIILRYKRLERKNYASLILFFIPDWYFMNYFLPLFILNIYLVYFRPFNDFLALSSWNQEPAEFVLSLGFFLFVFINRLRLKQQLGSFNQNPQW